MYEAQRNYYKRNKEKVLENQKKWREQNKERFGSLCQKSRKLRVEKLREKGVVNAWGVVLKGEEERYERKKGSRTKKEEV